MQYVNNEYSLKKVAFFLLLLIALFAIPLTVYLVQRQQEIRTRATQVPEDTVVMVIDGQQYTKADVRKIAEEQNDPSTVDSEALKVALGTLEERKILDKATSELGIQIDSAQVQKLTEDDYSDLEARYEVLKNQVILAAVKSRQALSIEFWNPPADSLNSLSAAEKTAAANELRDGIPALAEAENRLKTGEEILDVGDSLIVKYPSLKPVLAINGNILDSLVDSEREEARRPRIYEFGDSNLDKETLDALFAMNVDEIRSITNTKDNRGGTVFRLASKGNDSGEPSYESWLEKQKSSLVRQVSSLKAVQAVSQAEVKTKFNPFRSRCVGISGKFTANNKWKGGAIQVGCAGDGGGGVQNQSQKCSGEVQNVKPGQTFRLTKCSCFGSNKGCLRIGKELRLEPLKNGKRKITVVKKIQDMPAFKNNSCKINSVNNVCGSNGKHITGNIKIRCSAKPVTPTKGPSKTPTPKPSATPTPKPSVTPTPSVCPGPEKVTNVKVTCPNCFSEENN